MNFTVDMIENIMKKPRSGADFPKLVQELKSLGVVKFDFSIVNGLNKYFISNGEFITVKSDELVTEISETSSKEGFKRNLKIHQKGETDFRTFCIQSANAGVNSWTCDLVTMTVKYLDKRGKIILEENIPS